MTPSYEENLKGYREDLARLKGLFDKYHVRLEDREEIRGLAFDTTMIEITHRCEDCGKLGCGCIYLCVICKQTACDCDSPPSFTPTFTLN